MPTLSFDPVAVTGDTTVRVPCGPHAPANVRGVLGSRPGGQPQALTKSLVVAGAPDPEESIALSKFGGAEWLTIPESCEHGVPFEIELDGSGLKPGVYSEVVTAACDGYTPAQCVVELRIDPMG
jgi:hypothetical protein